MAIDPLISAAALVELSSRGRIRVTGEDRARLLHAMCTNHIQQLEPGQGVYAFFLNAQGRILSDAYILCFADHFLLDTEPATREALYAHLDKYIIADDVTLEDVTLETYCLALEGSQAAATAEAAGLPAPNHAYSHMEWGESSVAAISATGTRGVRIYGALTRKEETVQSLEAVGAIAISPEETERARILNFRPRYGVEISETNLPQETQQMHALHFQKGCYLGQEIVERIRSRGHVNKTLMGFELTAENVPERGAKVLADEKETGEVLSATGAGEGRVRGLAMIRLPHNRPGVMVGIGTCGGELFEPGRC